MSMSDSTRTAPGALDAFGDDDCIRAELGVAASMSGELPPDEREQLFAHLLECDSCLHVAVELMSGEPS